MPFHHSSGGLSVAIVLAVDGVDGARVALFGRTLEPRWSSEDAA
jgi:hypothetical protein